MNNPKYSAGIWLKYYPGSPEPTEYVSVFEGNPNNDLAGFKKHLPEYIPIKQAIAAPELLAAFKELCASLVQHIGFIAQIDSGTISEALEKAADIMLKVEGIED